MTRLDKALVEFARVRKVPCAIYMGDEILREVIDDKRGGFRLDPHNELYEGIPYFVVRYHTDHIRIV